MKDGTLSGVRRVRAVRLVVCKREEHVEISSMDERITLTHARTRKQQQHSNNNYDNYDNYNNNYNNN